MIFQKSPLVLLLLWITSAEEVVFLAACVSLYVRVQNTTNSFDSSLRSGAWPKEQSIRFWWQSGSSSSILTQFFTPNAFSMR